MPIIGVSLINFLNEAYFRLIIFFNSSHSHHQYVKDYFLVLFHVILILLYFPFYHFSPLFTHPTFHPSGYLDIVCPWKLKCLLCVLVICINHIFMYRVSCYFHSPEFCRSFHVVQCKSSSLLLTAFQHMPVPHFTWPFPRVAHNFLPAQAVLL